MRKKKTQHELLNTHEFQSEPESPIDLWDTDDLLYLNKVRCQAVMRVISIDPKQGTFNLRLKCHWRFRTLNTGDRTETHLKVPGLRMPGLVVEVEESRIWRDMKMSTDKTLFWKGTSQFNIAGFEMYEMSDFPFDRQIINLDLLEFVWRGSKDTDTYDFSMNLVYFRVMSESLLPEWDPLPASMSVEQILKTGDRITGPTSASRFQVQLRMERKVGFYIIQIYLVTLLITIITAFPLALPAADFIGDRLTIYGTGVLTLVAYKYGIADSLPPVPYQTYTDKILVRQIMTVSAIAFEALIAFQLVTYNDVDKRIVEISEHCGLVVVVCIWLVVFVYTAKFKVRIPWDTVQAQQEKNMQTDPTSDDD